MRRILAVIACGGAGFWLGANHLVPLWGIWLLAGLGGGLWGLVVWLERRKGADHDSEN
jgi:uncharacterized iron-regulated membrane protein